LSLDDRQVELFSRQVLLREVGGRGQERLLAARVLVLGDGPEAEAAATYLAGAGIGTLGTAGFADGAGSVGFAPLRERCPDATVVVVSAAGEIDLATWDVVIETGSRGGSGHPRARGRARRGAVAVATDEQGGTIVLSVPAIAGGCTACRVAGPGGAGEESAAVRTGGVGATGAAGQRVVDLLLAGDMAALAACAFLLGLDPAPATRAFRLDVGAPAFVATEVRRIAPCPRACGA